MRKMTLFSGKHIIKVGSVVAVALLGAGVSVWAGNDTQESQKLSAFSKGKEIRYAGLFPWLSQENPTNQAEKLRFKAVKIAPNGNGIFSGEARPGYDVFLKEQETKVAFAKTDPEGLWVAVVKQPLKDRSKTYSLHSQTPDGNVQHVSKQSLEIEIPDNRMNGAMIRVVEEGQKPIVLAENLPIPTVLSVSANAAEVKDNKSSKSQAISVSSSEYQDSGEDVGRVVLSGKAKKNTSLRISINDSEVGVVKADKQGNWSLSEVFALKPGADHKLRIEQIDKSGKVLGKIETGYKGPEITAKTEEQTANNSDVGAAKKEETFWQKVTGMFSSDDSGEKPGSDKAAQPDEKSGEKMAADVESGETTKNKLVSSDGTGASAEGSDLGSKEREAAKEAMKTSVSSNGKGQAGDVGSSPFVKEKSGVSGRKTRRKTARARKGSSRRSRKSTRHMRSKGAKRSRKARTRKSRNRRSAKLRKAKRNRAKRRRAATFRHKNRARKYNRKRSFRNRKLRLAKYRRRHKSKRLKRYTSRRYYRKMRAVSRRKFRRSRRRVAAIRRKRKIRIRRGDTLWDLARIKYGHGRYYRRIYRANRRRLSSPNHLRPNQRLFLPA